MNAIEKLFRRISASVKIADATYSQFIECPVCHGHGIFKGVSIYSKETVAYLQCKCGAKSDITDQVKIQQRVAMARMYFQMSLMKMDNNEQALQLRRGKFPV